MKRTLLFSVSLLALVLSLGAQARTQEAVLHFYYQNSEKAKGYEVVELIQMNTGVNYPRAGRAQEDMRRIDEFSVFRVEIKQTRWGLDLLFFDKIQNQLITKLKYQPGLELINNFESQGFTGLHYIYHPTGAVLQFFGSVK